MIETVDAQVAVVYGVAVVGFIVALAITWLIK